MELRQLGNTNIKISTVALGCWPMAGLTSPGANDANSIAAIQECFDLGINHLDTAFMYGPNGESEKLIARSIAGKRDEVVIATKGGLHLGPANNILHDGSSETLRKQCDESLRRLKTDRVELYYLHAPDPGVPVAESAGGLKRLLDEGKTLSVGVSNMSVEQLEEFSSECPIAAFQPPYNMLMRQIERDTLPWCRENNVSVLVYWPLLKGLLAGKIARDHVFSETDSRRKYPMFFGEEWEKNHILLDKLREIAKDAGYTVAELVINWTINQPGITAALCGAKRPDQIRETAGGAGWELTAEQREWIGQSLRERGEPDSGLPV